MNNESYEGIFGKGILLFVGLSYLFFLFFGGFGKSWMNLDTFSGDYLLLIGMCYVMHFKLVFEENLNADFTQVNQVFIYAIMNLVIALGFNVQYLMVFSIFQAILLNGYTGSIFYKGVSQIKWKVYEDSLEIIKQRKKEAQKQVE